MVQERRSSIFRATMGSIWSSWPGVVRMGPDSRLVTMFVDDSENAVLSQRKSPDLIPSPYRMSGEEDTGQGISVFTPDSQNGASHMTGSSMPNEGGNVKGWDTPEAAREAEALELAQQDEALRHKKNPPPGVPDGGFTA